MSHAAPTRTRDRGRRTNISTAALAAVAAAVAVTLPRWHDLGWLAAVGVLQAALVWAWMLGTAVPGKWGGVLLGLGAGAAADAGLLLDRHDGLTPLLTVLGLLFPALVAHQLARGVVRTRVTESLAGIAGLCAVVVALSCYLQLHQDTGTVAEAALLAAAVGLLAGRLLDTVRPAEGFAEGVFHSLLGVLGAGLAGAAAALVRLHGWPVSVAGAGLLGGGVGVTVGLVAVGAGYIAVTVRPRRTPFAPFTLPVLRVLLPLALAAPVAYLLGLVVTG
jgi:hypothetical protein